MYDEKCSREAFARPSKIYRTYAPFLHAFVVLMYAPHVQDSATYAFHDACTPEDEELARLADSSKNRCTSLLALYVYKIEDCIDDVN